MARKGGSSMLQGRDKKEAGDSPQGRRLSFSAARAQKGSCAP
jgi:hypothetical protein